MTSPQTPTGRALALLLAEADIRWPDEHTRIATSAIAEMIVRIEDEALNGTPPTIIERHGYWSTDGYLTVGEVAVARAVIARTVIPRESGAHVIVGNHVWIWTKHS